MQLTGGMRVPGVLLLGVVVLGVGCYADEYAYPSAQTGGAVSIGVPPPAPVAEVPPAAPSPGMAWTAGYWDWQPASGRYAWVAGHWVVPPRAGVVWVPPEWHADEHGRYYRSQGHWTPGVTRDRYGRQVWYDSAGRPHYM